MYKVVLAIALVGAVSAELSCEDCSMIGDTTSNWASSEAGIQGQIDYLMGPLCADAPVELDCMTNFPGFWTAIAKALFDPSLGWFAPASMCMDVCAKKTFLKTPTCDDCAMRLYGSISFMADEEIQIKIIADFVEGDFCAQFADDMEECMTALELVIPQAMNMLAVSGDSWVGNFCADQVGCA